MSSTYRKALEEYLSGLEIRAERVLDVGGAQLPVKDRVKHWDVKDYAIVDLPMPHEGDVGAHVPFDLNSAADPHLQPADVVFCLEVMEYIWDPAMAVSNLARMMKKDGELHISFPYFYPPHEPYERDYMRYTLAGAKKLIAEAGLETVELVERPCLGNGMMEVIEDNALRPSKRMDAKEAFYTLGYIIVAQKKI